MRHSCSSRMLTGLSTVKERNMGSSNSSGTPDKVHGEGNYEASREYNRATKKFVDVPVRALKIFTFSGDSDAHT